MRNLITVELLLFGSFDTVSSQLKIEEWSYKQILIFTEGHKREYNWKIKNVGDLICTKSEYISTVSISTDDRIPAILASTLLNSPVHNGIHPESYFRLKNNKIKL